MRCVPIVLPRIIAGLILSVEQPKRGYTVRCHLTGIIGPEQVAWPSLHLSREPRLFEFFLMGLASTGISVRLSFYSQRGGGIVHEHRS